VPVGGAERIIDALTRRLASRGGAIRCNAEVVEVAVRRGRAAGVAIDGVAQIECELVDVDGRPVKGELPVTVESSGRILGLENGDLADVTSYDGLQRSTFDGRLAVFARSGEDAAVRLSAPGVDAVTVQI
jgi:hypothetical protein